LQEPEKKDPVIVAGKDVGEVDVDYFLIPVNIRDHEGPLRTSFPIENRLLPQGPPPPQPQPHVRTRTFFPLLFEPEHSRAHLKCEMADGLLWVKEIWIGESAGEGVLPISWLSEK